MVSPARQLKMVMMSNPHLNPEYKLFLFHSSNSIQPFQRAGVENIQTNFRIYRVSVIKQNKLDTVLVVLILCSSSLMDIDIWLKQ